MASAALALLALRLIMTAAVAIEAMIEMIREQMIRMAKGDAELEPAAMHWVLGPVVFFEISPLAGTPIFLSPHGSHLSLPAAPV